MATSVGAGDLDQRITLLRPVNVADEGGGFERSWEEVATVWASVKPLRGKETLEADRQTGVTSYRIWVRQNPTLLYPVTNNMRIRWRWQTLNIRSVLDEGPKALFTEIIAETEAAL